MTISDGKTIRVEINESYVHCVVEVVTDGSALQSDIERAMERALAQVMEEFKHGR